MSFLLISVVGLLVIACGIVCTVKKCYGPLLSRSPDSWTPDCPDTSFGMLQLSSEPRRAEENTYVTHAPRPRRPTDFSPVPLLAPSYTVAHSGPSSTTVTGNTTSIRMPKQSPLLNQNLTEAPPPSYNEIFPPDYVPDDSIMRGSNNRDSPQQTSDTNV